MDGEAAANILSTGSTNCKFNKFSLILLFWGTKMLIQKTEPKQFRKIVINFSV